MLRILVGLVCIGAALSGRVVLLGTSSPAPLLGVGGVLIALGLFQVMRRRSDQGDGIQ